MSGVDLIGAPPFDGIAYSHARLNDLTLASVMRASVL